MGTVFDEAMPLHEARDVLRELVDDGCACPCCTQFAKVYRRPIHAAMAVDLIRCYRYAGQAWFLLTDVVGKRGTGDVTKLRYWGLMQQAEGKREDGSKRIGVWRITPAGVAWLNAHTAVPRWARVYDSRCLGLIGDPVTIRDALGARFNYDELMRA
jgi:hypothetical protein